MNRKELDALFQRQRHVTTQAEYLEKLAREREYLEGQIARLAAGKSDRESVMRVELQEALKESLEAEEAVLEGDWFDALEIRDRMHIRLHQTKLFDWQPLLKDGAELAPYRKSKSTGKNNLKEQSDVNRRQADNRALANFHKWCAAPLRRAELVSLTVAERLRKYIRVASPRPKDRERRRLNAMLKDGTLK